jgi:hypothetical protein
MKLQAGDPAEALTAYEQPLAIVRDLAKDKTNSGAQRCVAVILDKIGNGLVVLRGRMRDSKIHRRLS